MTVSEVDLKVAQTVQIDTGTLVDVAEDGQIIGIEAIGYPVNSAWLKVLRAARMP